MPSFNGVPLFGIGVTMATGDVELDRQENSFPGTIGVESLTHGTRGTHTIVSGTLFGASAGDLALAENLFRTYRDGIGYVLVDSFGVAWPNVLLNAFAPKGRIKQTPVGTFFRPYEAQFRHLSLS